MNQLNTIINTVDDVCRLVRAGFTSWSALGDVRVIESPCGRWLKFCYTKKAVISGRWNAFERMSRGLIIDTEGDIVARPWPKFFNWGERGRTTSALISEVTTKIDGSLGILHYDLDGVAHVTTKGSFTSEQALWATEYVRKRRISLNPECTWLVEIVYPDNKIVVDYDGFEGLYLLGGIFNSDGVELRASTLDIFARKGFRRPKIWHIEKPADLTQLAKAWADLDTEGWVALFRDGSRFKFKTPVYLQAHRAIHRLSKKRILEYWANDNLAELYSVLPEEFHPKVDVVQAEAGAHLLNASVMIGETDFVCEDFSRKEFARFVNDNLPTHIRSAAFMARDGKDHKPQLHKAIAKYLLQEAK